MRCLLFTVVAILLMPAALASGTLAANAGPDRTVVVGTLVDLQATGSTNATGHAIVSYIWDLDDGTSAAGAEVSHRFTTAGTHDVRLLVTDDTGATASDVARVTVVADATPPQIQHTPPARPANGLPLPLEASIVDDGAVAAATLRYTNGSSIREIPMSQDGDTWRATIPATSVVPGLRYAIAASDLGGNTVAWPARDMWNVTFGDDLPRVASAPGASAPANAFAFRLSAGSSPIARVVLHYHENGTRSVHDLPLTPATTDGARYDAAIPGISAATPIRWSLEITDAAGHATRYPATGENTTIVSVAPATAPTNALATATPTTAAATITKEAPTPGPATGLVVLAVAALALAGRRAR